MRNSLIAKELSNDSPDTTFTCIFCHHDKSVTVRVDRKEGVAQLICKVCDQRFQSKVNRTSVIFVVHCGNAHLILADLTEAIDIYSEWIDAADAAQREEQQARRRPVGASSSRAARGPAVGSDDE